MDLEAARCRPTLPSLPSLALTQEDWPESFSSSSSFRVNPTPPPLLLCPAHQESLTRQHVGADEQVRQELFCRGLAGSQRSRIQVLREKLPEVCRISGGRDQEIWIWGRGTQPYRWLESRWPLDAVFG